MTLKTHITVYFSSLPIGLIFCDNNYIIEIMVYFLLYFFPSESLDRNLLPSFELRTDSITSTSKCRQFIYKKKYDPQAVSSHCATFLAAIGYSNY